MAPPSASAVGSHIGGPSPSPPLGIRAQFRRQGSSYGHSHVHHMALMVAPKRVDYSVNKGGLKTWIVLIVFVLLCSAILTIFSDENESELANEAPLADQKDRDEEDNDGGGEEPANIPSAEGITGADDGEEDEEKEEDEEEEEEEQEEKDEQRENVKDDDADDEEERMLAKLKEAAEMARQRQKEEAKLKARKEAKKRQRMEKEKEEEDRRREKTKREEEEKDEEERQREKTIREVEEKEKEEEKEEEIEKRQQEKEEEKDEEEEEEEKEQQIWERSRHGKKEKRVPSWRGTQLQAAKEDTQKPRMNLLKQRKKRIFDQRVRSNDQEEEEEREEGEEEDDGEEAHDEAEEEEAVVVVGELITTRKRPIYNRKALTNRYDYKHRSLLDAADFLLEKHEFDGALKHYQQILAINEHSPRALFGLGRLHQLKAEFGTDHDDDSEKFIKMALSDYNTVLENEDTPDELFKMTVHYFVECARQMGGYHHKILQAQRALVDRFPDDADIKCDFGATWLGMARPEKAADIFRNVLDNEPGHALALAYLGYIQKVYEDELERGVHALRRAMRTGDERVTGDARFYFHLGDGLVKLGRNREALEVYGDAVKHGVFPSVHQRSVHNLLGLSARPWWTVEQSECAKQLKTMERQWTAIREEALKVWSKKKSLFVEEALPIGSSGMMGGGELALVLRSNAIGGFREEICDRLMQSTCELLKHFETASCAKDKIKLSVLLAGTRTWPFCGPTNYVLEAQLGLVAHSDARIRVGNETRGWRPGRFLVFDTSFEREISFEGAPSNAIRLALTMELWHPQMPMELRGKIRAADGSDEERK